MYSHIQQKLLQFRIYLPYLLSPHKYNYAKISADKKIKDQDNIKVMANVLENRSFTGIRSDWLYWNSFVPEYDEYFQPHKCNNGKWKQQLRVGEQSNITKQLYAYFLIMLRYQVKSRRIERVKRLFTG